VSVSRVRSVLRARSVSEGTAGSSVSLLVRSLTVGISPRRDGVSSGFVLIGNFGHIVGSPTFLDGAVGLALAFLEPSTDWGKYGIQPDTDTVIAAAVENVALHAATSVAVITSRVCIAATCCCDSVIVQVPAAKLIHTLGQGGESVSEARSSEVVAGSTASLAF
jgi:hypothetical protein